MQGEFDIVQVSKHPSQRKETPLQSKKNNLFSGTEKKKKIFEKITKKIPNY